jgi:hypothetical protein
MVTHKNTLNVLKVVTVVMVLNFLFVTAHAKFHFLQPSDWAVETPLLSDIRRQISFSTQGNSLSFELFRFLFFKKLVRLGQSLTIKCDYEKNSNVGVNEFWLHIVHLLRTKWLHITLPK